ncbi:alpha/beta hydrolase [Paenibacillus radicis (ex Gao et al. 2016)]|uniref:Acetylesterase n=1 Tax=Paenibacillus radicis (ex Gao et al. 2016) TaxID=1737354 RepID=A0A917M454_9BACL|nr:alpha/beta hydrolase [Paenibacillus radicis (ex Gao et al. 2016)]GGG75839.1 acetylesterase [Paenibacillus radicis (ex Gao et al. 2016)]
MEKFAIWPEGAVDEASEIPFLTPYLKATDKPLAAIIVLPGGGYAYRAEHEGKPIAEWLNDIGLHAFVLDYRVAPNQHPHPLNDAKRALRLVRSRAAEFGVDPSRIGILGFSAGGHLASTAGTQYDAGDVESADPIERVSSRPDLMVLCYPVISLGKYTHPGSLVNLLGEDSSQQQRDSLSGELQVTSDTPPTFLWHTADDSAVPVQNSLLFSQALSENGVPFELHVYESGHHGLGLAYDHPEAHTWTLNCANWLKRRGFVDELPIIELQQQEL